MIKDLVDAADRGDESAARELFSSLYRELHSLAEHHLRRGGSDLTLGTTTLLHETYLALANREGARFPDRKRFLAYASKALRGIVIDYARARRAKKRGGEFEIATLDQQEPAGAGGPADEALERLGQALEELSRLEPELAQVVDLHYFAGFSFKEIAGIQDSSERTVSRTWRKARLLLQRLMATE